MSVSLRVVGPAGEIFSADGLAHVVLRRREPGRTPGSEIAIYPHHAPTLMQTEECDARLIGSSGARSVHLAAGVAEVLEDRITLVVP